MSSLSRRSRVYCGVSMLEVPLNWARQLSLKFPVLYDIIARIFQESGYLHHCNMLNFSCYTSLSSTECYCYLPSCIVFAQTHSYITARLFSTMPALSLPLHIIHQRALAFGSTKCNSAGKVDKKSWFSINKLPSSLIARSPSCQPASLTSSSWVVHHWYHHLLFIHFSVLAVEVISG